jgi:type IV pilus assembly protein PilQ
MEIRIATQGFARIKYCDKASNRFMLSKTGLTTSMKASAAAVLLLLGLPACKHSEPMPDQAPVPRVKYDETLDQELQDVLVLARSGKWEDAQVKADALATGAPKNAMALRVQAWVRQQRERQREQALEDKIREIDAKHSVFNPSIKDLLTENKDRGLPASKDVRDTVQRIENAPYIPESYGKVITEKGPLFDLESVKGKMARVLEKEVTMHVDNMPLETIIMNLSASTGVNIVADKALAALKQTLTVNLDKVRLGEFLRYIGRNYDLQFQVGDELVWVVDAKDPKKLMEETRFYRLRKGFILPAEFGSEDVNKTAVTVNNVTTLTEATKFKRFVNDMTPNVPSIEKAVKELFLGSKWFVDYERNLVVARGTEEQLQVMEKIIEEFDRPVQQVLIEARFVTISKPAFLRLGVLWETGRARGSVRIPRDFTGLVGSQDVPALGIGLQETFTNVLGRDSLSATISALEQSGESQTLSSPRLTVLNNRPATIADGKVQYYYEEYQVKTVAQQYYTASSFVPAGRPTKITAGAELNVMASISGDGRNILLALNPRVNTDVQMVKYATLTDYNAAGNVQNTFDINLPQYRTQELATRVAVRSGETVAMGGVIERTRSTYVESVPVLGNLPLIGALFRRRTEQDIPRYLLIFVTATILTDSGEMLIYDDNSASTNGSSSRQ